MCEKLFIYSILAQMSSTTFQLGGYWLFEVSRRISISIRYIKS